MQPDGKDSPETAPDIDFLCWLQGNKKREIIYLSAYATDSKH